MVVAPGSPQSWSECCRGGGSAMRCDRFSSFCSWAFSWCCFRCTTTEDEEQMGNLHKVLVLIREIMRLSVVGDAIDCRSIISRQRICR